MENKPTWQLAEQICEVPAIDEAIRTFVEDNTGDNAIGIILAVLKHQAATEAAKTTSVAVGEMLPLPEPLEIDWPELNSNALGCGVEDRGIRDRYEAAEYGWQDGVDKAIERVPEAIYDTNQMRAYGQQCAEAARQPAPALPERVRELECVIADLTRECNELRAALAATAAPVLSDEQILQMFANAVGNENDKAKTVEVYPEEAIAFARNLLAATRSQP